MIKDPRGQGVVESEARTSLRTAEGRMIQAEIAQREQEWKIWRAQHLAEGGAMAVTPLALLIAANKRFGSDDLRQITQFVARYNAAAPADERQPPREMEALLRSLLGEAHLADAVPGESAAKIARASLIALADEMVLTQDEVDMMLVAAESLVLLASSQGQWLPTDWALPPSNEDDRMLRRPRRRHGELDANAAGQGR